MIKITSSQYVPNDPQNKYGKMVVQVEMPSGDKKMYCGILDYDGKIETWYPIPHEREVQASLLEYIGENK